MLDKLLCFTERAFTVWPGSVHCNRCALFCYSCKHSVHSTAGEESFCSFHWGKIALFGFSSDLIIVLKYMTFCLVLTTNPYFSVVSHGSWLWEWFRWCQLHVLRATVVIWGCEYPHFLADCWPDSLVPLRVVLTMGCRSILTSFFAPKLVILERRPETDVPIFYNCCGCGVPHMEGVPRLPYP